MLSVMCADEVEREQGSEKRRAISEQTGGVMQSTDATRGMLSVHYSRDHQQQQMIMHYGLP